MAISTISPARALPGARVTLSGKFLPLPADAPPHVTVGGHDARVVGVSPHVIRILVPASAEGGRMQVRIAERSGDAVLDVGRQVVTNIHQVDSPVFGRDGTLYITHSGGRDSKAPISLFIVGRDGVQKPLHAEVPNPTSLAIGPDDALYVSSRFEGIVYRVRPETGAEVYATELGVPTGLAFGRDGALFVGDRSGSILRVSPKREVETFASLPASIAAFHLAFGPDDCLYVTAPTLATHDALYRITPDRLVDVVEDRFGRPQGLAFDASGALFVVDALAGGAGLYRVNIHDRKNPPELIVGAASIVGVAFDPLGGMVVAAPDTIYRFE